MATMTLTINAQQVVGCNAPTGLSGTGAAGSFTADWDDVTEALGYSVSYKLTFQSGFMTDLVFDSTSTVTGLNPGQYDVEIRTICALGAQSIPVAIVIQVT